MGGVLSHPPQQLPGSSDSITAPRVTRSTSRILSYFVPSMSTPDLTHSHPRPAGPATITVVCRLLTYKGLPMEIAQRVVEDARYWTRCTRTNRKPCTVVAGMAPPRQAQGGQLEKWTSGQEEELKEEMDMAGSGLKDRRGQVWYLASSPIGCRPPRCGPPEEGPDGGEGSTGSWVREIVVQTFSRDQGWSDNATHYGTYDASYSWFELSLLRNGREVPESRTKIQYNIHAGQYNKSHHNLLDQKHAFVTMAKEGDRVVLWGRAEFPGWTNNIKEATITIYTAPFAAP